MTAANANLAKWSRPLGDWILAGLFAVAGVSLLILAGVRLADDAGLLLIATVAASILCLASAVGLWFRWRWAWGLIVFLCILIVIGVVVALGVLLAQVNEARQAGQALNLLGILSRLILFGGVIVLPLVIIRYLSRNWPVPASALALPYIGPTLLGILLFSVYPIVYNVGLSFTNRNLFRFQPCPEGMLGFETCPSKGFVFAGLLNYLKLLGDLRSDFVIVMARSLLWTVICVTLFLILGLVLALILNSPLVKGRAIYRVVLIVPWAIPFYISALVWKFFFNGEFGTINNLLRTVGWAAPPTWLNQPATAFGAVVIINLWMSYPFFMTIILGALQAIPQDLYEAAEADGANWWQKLRLVTLPLIRPAIIPGVVLSALTTFKLFETVWMVTAGGPFTGSKTGATEIVMVYAYRQAFQLFNYGYISAFAVVLFIILFAATMFNLRFARITRGVYE